MKLTKAKQKQLDEAYDTLIQVCLYDRPLKDMEPFLADDVMNFGAGRKELTKTKAAFLKQIKNQKKLAAGLKMDFQIKPVLRKITNKGDGAIYTDDIVNTIWVSDVKNKLQFRLSFIFEYRDRKWIMVHSHTSTPDSQRSDDEIWPVEELKKRTEVLEISLDEKIAELEIKNRELEIEAALEKVRSRSLAMHKSDELQQVINILFDRVKDLNIETHTASIILPKNDSKETEAWMQNSEHTYSSRASLPYFEKSILSREFSDLMQEGKDLVSRCYSKAEKDEYFTSLFEHSELKHIPDERKQYILAGEAYTISIANSEWGAILLGRYSAKPFMENENAIIKRFAKVFGQAYTRFLDLQKAEAQARETEIELSLERVRAKTMAMQKPSEFVDVINIIGAQFVHLAFDIDWVNFGASGFDISEGIDIWNFAVIPGASPISARVLIPYFDHPVFTTSAATINEFINGGKDFITVTLDKQTKDKWLDHLFTKTIFKDVPEEYRVIQYAKPGYTTSNISLKDTWLSIGKFDIKNFTDEQHAILRRFANAFGQAYTRFLDLQKAEAQAREAQIETSLERVRAKAMAMHSSEDLVSTISSFFTELQSLRVTSLRCGVSLVNEESRIGNFTATAATEEGQSKELSGNLTLAGHAILDAIYDNWKNQKEYHPVLKGDEIRKYYEVMNPEVEFPDFPNELVQFGHYFSFKEGFVFAWTENELKEEELRIFRKFTSVLSLTHRRYKDLKEAEAQAREAKIEAALEKVRARTMAMQQSIELGAAAALMFQQVQSFGVASFSCGFNIWEPDDTSITSYMAKPDGTFEAASGSRLPHTEHPHYIQSYEARKRGEEFFVLEAGGKELEDTYRYMFSLPDFKKEFDDWKDSGFPVPTFQISHYVFFLQGYLLFITYQQVPEMWDIFKRFGKVFDQTYTRFLDLQKAEAQAREAQIEAALERVRSRTMAMHRSEEIADIVGKMFEELKRLDMVLVRVLIWIFNDDEKYISWWSANTEVESTANSYRVDYNEHPVFLAVLEAWQQKVPLKLYTLSGAEKDSWQDHLFNNTGLSKLPDMVQKGMRSEGTIFTTSAISDYGLLMSGSLEPLSDENTDIIQRFGRVFQQSYTRYIDVQKAEAQAREAQIQLALERVRARTMAMQKSDELMEAAHLLFQQVQSLGIPVWACGYNIWEKGEKVCIGWMSVQGAIQPSFRIPLTEHRTFIHMNESRLKAETFYVEEVSGEELADHYRYMFSLPDFREIATKQLQGSDFPLPLSQINHVFNFKHGNLIFISAEAIPEAWDIFKRFTAVFEQTYTRFLDLQKAEAQAREAQIEAALERVRSRSMAMHKSDELAKVASVMFEEIRILGGELWSAGLVLCEKDKPVMEQWMSMTTLGLLPPFHIPVDLDKFHRNMYEAWKTGVELYTEEFTETEIKKRHELLMGLPDVREAFDKIREAGIQAPKWQKNYVAPFKNGVLFTIVTSPFGDEKIFPRFARVFEQTYTRFLDLKKAEAQAREAQIEAALEKVRSRSLAMHKSDELKDVVSVVFEKLRELNVAMDSACFLTFTEGDNGYTAWAANPDLFSVTSARVPYFDDPIIKTIHTARNTGEAFIAKTWTFEEKNSHWEYLFEHSDWKHLPDDLKTAIREFEGWGFTGPITKNSATLLVSYREKLFSEQDNEIIKRFGNVFDQAYIRFLDLQKAEAQSREAQIELGLERVRARAMAMQNSDQLKELIGTVFIELTKLDIVLTRCLIMIYDTVSNDSVWWMANSEAPADPIGLHIKYHEYAPYLAYINAWREKNLKWVYVLEGADKKSWDDFLFLETELSHLPDFVIDGMKAPNRVYLNASFNSFGNLTLASLDPLTNEHFDILLRFAKVFDLTYTRFNDLQKAEAQAREAQIEAALERVRSRTMAMHKSDELLEVITVVSGQLQQLNFKFDNVSFGANNPDYDIKFWMSIKARPHPILCHAPYVDNPIINRVKEAQKKGRGYLFSDILTQEENQQWINHLYNNADVSFPEEIKNFLLKSPGYSRTVIILNNIFFFIGNYSAVPYTNEENSIFSRFANVFEQSYTRFLDLQKAEAQAREAQVEAALERVRAKAMAMHSSEDLSETIKVFYHQLGSLNITPRRCGVGLIDKEAHKVELSTMNTTEGGDSIESVGTLKLIGHPVLEGIYDHWLLQKEYHPVLRGKEIKEYYQIIRPQIAYPEYSSDTAQYGYFFFFNEGGVYAWTEKEMTDDELQICRRFTTVLSLTYKRYKDLQQAEANASEAQVEAALERVRAKAMAMHNSADLAETIKVFYQQMGLLNLMPRRCGVGLIDKETHIADLTGMIISEQGETKEIAGKLKLADHPVLLNVYENWLLQNEYHPVLRGNEIKEYYELIGSQVSFKNFPDDSVQFGYFFFFPEGAVYAWTEKEFTEGELKIYRRFTSVLSLTYKRYKDLKQAEAQAREAKIEAAMEKVRARAMAMQKPNELIEVAELLRKEMGMLGVEELETSSIYIHNEASGKTECWFAIKDGQHEKKLIADHMTIDLTETGVGRQMMDFYRSDKKQISIVMQGAKRKEWINYCADHAKVFGSSGFYGDNIPDRTYHLYKFSNGYMGAASPGDISAESWGLLQRATAVFSLAYTRFNDLQQAETSAREAVKQAALDRVRAEIASMRTINDLDRITPLIWNELTILGISFIRCGVFIMDESQKLIHTFLSTPDGKAIGAFHLPYDTPNMVKILDHWREKSRYIDHWDEIIFTEFADTLVKQGALASPEQYLKTIPHGGFHLHFLPFLQGMLYVGNTNQLSEDEIKLIQSVADAFSTAYARYEDFNKLEAAKQQVDKTLTDLKQAQTQLVQSEKMASLGELTAGIAHEIQNPLNFVNNFSDVSNELLDEMKAELQKGNKEDAMAIVDDVKQNLEKILHHGKRADAIVKGMLQHSRASSGQKEPTDINILADEYLRLAYHGLRAKDKSFNAKFETFFDDRVGKINIIPQEMGRVILNLINNGFYAVSEKKKAPPPPEGGIMYEPVVTVITKKENGKVEIRVQDNGIGIPPKMLDKIFQPFFTTKPTGEGTGLGLSLAYDIVKAHGGELKVETREGEGSEFVIQLPVV